jgi:methionine biosynthesis protein MetW
MHKNNYYDLYWSKRLRSEKSYPIPKNIPHFLKKYSAYGSILNQIPIDSEILDLGCGNGNVARVYLEKGSVTGVDVSDIALKEAKKQGIITKIHNLNIFPYPFGTNSFNVVILTDVLEHCLNPVLTLKEVKRIVKPKGKIIITVPNFARFGNRLRMIIGDPTDLLHFSKYGDEVEHLHWFTQAKLEYLIKNIGFSNYIFIPTGLQNMNFIYGILGLFNLGNFLTVVIQKT